jgi:ABC-type glycerol-3-phosphate transport system substrate-binding protein
MLSPGSNRPSRRSSPSLTRRRFLAGLAPACAVVPLLAACGGSVAATVSTAASSGSAATTTNATGSATASQAPTSSVAAATSTANAATTSSVAASVSAASAATSSTSAAPASSVAQAAAGQKTLLLWGQDVFYKAGTLGDTFIKEFAQQNPDLKVISEPQAYSTTKIPQMVAAGTVPDFAHMDRYLAAEWGNKGVIEPLDAMLARSKILIPSDWRDGLRSDVTWKGKVFAVPQGSDVWLFYWNKPAYQAVGLPQDTAPATWDDLKQSSQKLYQADASGAIQRYGFAPQFGNGGPQAAWLIFMWQQGQEELSPDRTKAIFNTDLGLNALNLVVGFVQAQGGWQRYLDFTKGLSPQAQKAALPEGKISSHLDYQGEVDNIWKPAVPNFSPDVYGAGLIPKPPNGKDTTYQGGPTYVIPTGAKNPTDSFRFLEYISTAANQVRWADGEGAVPTSKSVLASDAYLSKDPVRKIYAQLALGGKWVPVVPGGADILKLHSQLMTDALTGAKSPHDALTAAQTAIQQVLDKNMAGS